MAMILNGKALAARIREKIQQRVTSLPSVPKLAVVLVGEDPASHLYVSLKETACREAGIDFEKTVYAADVSEDEIVAKVESLNADKGVTGILVQLPLPTQSADRVIRAINPLKDVDGFHPENLKKLEASQPTIASAVALGVMRLIREAVGSYKMPPKATIVSSPLFAKPLELLLVDQGVTVTVTQAEDEKLASKTVGADILIVAEGMPALITKEMVKEGAIVIDVGTTRTDDGLKGDVDFDSVKEIAGAITPVPGGVGPMTVAMLLVNILNAYGLQSIDT
ncbi:MAG: bifunctional 5,10-methylenetetrahydrofolate dehydrogenase/5,10-methenyltetrahydrofolate cyclohydrolase [bacterium]|nr:bifunctional 5,10-methylenetetrahydrofolate dehydrogenase/5,10-methenyltetrahydrofolate cyclohydrolase [bacterium]